MKGIISIILLVSLGCNSHSGHRDLSPQTKVPVAPSSGLLNLLTGRWQLNTDTEQTMRITKDSLIDYYKGQVSRRSQLVFDSLSVADKYLLADSSYNFMKNNDYGMGFTLIENNGQDSTKLLLIYVDRTNLEIGSHNGIHSFTKVK